MSDALRHPKCRDDLIALAAKLRRRMDSLYVLSPEHDPWLADGEARARRAFWVAGIFEQFDIQSRVHARKIHYRLVSQKPPILQENGEPYVNTVECWKSLGAAIRDARYLGLISTDVVIDRRNPAPIINRDDDDDLAAEIEIRDGTVEQHDFGPAYKPPEFDLPEVLLAQEPSVGQPYHLELWIEKSTADEVLLPLGQAFRINVCRFLGEVSATACKDLVERAIASGKPVRIAYVSDFDPAGLGMPISAARKIDFFVEKSGHDLDIRLEPLALTEAQCLEFELPRTPIKEKEARAAGFEARYGSGATELDALQANHPGVLRDILTEWIDRYYDHDLDEEVERATEEYRDQILGAQVEIEGQFAEQLASLNEERERIAAMFDEVNSPAHADYQRAVSEAWRVYTEALEPVRATIAEMEDRLVTEAEDVLGQMKAALEQAVPDPESFDWPEPAEGDEDDDALYDSIRSYAEQVDAFRAHRGDDKNVGLAIDILIAKTCPACGGSFSSSNPRQAYCSAKCARRAQRKSARERGGAGLRHPVDRRATRYDPRHHPRR